MLTEITFAGRQARGSRDNQEDCYGFCLLGEGPTAPLLLALADGMGGHERGEVASELAVVTFINKMEVQPSNHRQALMDAVLASNERIDEENVRQGGEPDAMGTTFVGIYLLGNQLHYISVGDSPFYLFRNRSLFRLNEEHASEPEPATEHSPGRRGFLLSALTGGEISQVDAPDEALELEAGDILVCASDGLNSLDAKRLAGKLEVHGNLPAGEIAQLLVDAVEGERKNRQDNVTVCVIKPDLKDSSNVSTIPVQSPEQPKS
jgi:serine/threonine protein phosphatase PrpC